MKVASFFHPPQFFMGERSPKNGGNVGLVDNQTHRAKMLMNFLGRNRFVFFFQETNGKEMFWGFTVLENWS